MNTPLWDTIEAVPNLTSLPKVVIGRDVPGRLPLNAWSTLIPDIGRDDDPGRENPVIGRPDDETGRRAWSEDEDFGFEREVPGLGIEAMALSSRRISATPSSSNSVSST